MTEKLHPDMPIHQRVALITDALAVVLNRGLEMEVGQTGPYPGNLGVSVFAEPSSGYDTITFSLDDIARELEMRL